VAVRLLSDKRRLEGATLRIGNFDAQWKEAAGASGARGRKDERVWGERERERRGRAATINA
jgi:hypothetical protein